MYKNTSIDTYGSCNGIGTSVGIGVASGVITAAIGAVTVAGIVGYNIQKSINEAQKQADQQNASK